MNTYNIKEIKTAFFRIHKFLYRDESEEAREGVYHWLKNELVQNRRYKVRRDERRRKKK